MSRRSFVVSLIGRPNVGKSSLFNRLLGKGQKAITFNMPGVTRDRHYDVVTLDESSEWSSLDCILVDTGGFYPELNIRTAKGNHQDSNYEQKANIFYKAMVTQGEEAIRESDLVLLVVDGKEGLMPYDEAIVRYLREVQRKFWVVVNKVDNEELEKNIYDFYALGLDSDQIFSSSAAHNRGINDLKRQLQKAGIEMGQELNSTPGLERGITPRERVVGTVAIVGLPNAGKSTLLNALVGSPRALVSDVPGTTVDPIEAYFDLYFGDKANLLDEHIPSYDTQLLFKEYEKFRKNNPEVYDSLAVSYAEEKEDEASYLEPELEQYFEGEKEKISNPEVNESGIELDSQDSEPNELGDEEENNQQLYGQLFSEDQESTDGEVSESKELEAPSQADGSHWRSVHVVDTAGIRQKSLIKEEVEARSVYRALRAITESDIVIYLVDSMKGISHQDKRLISIAIEKGKSVVVGLNKFDLVLKKYKNGKERREYLTTMTMTSPWLQYCDVVPLTAHSRRGLGRLRDSLVKTFLIRRCKISTGELNRAVMELMDRTPAPMPGKARLKVKYCAQIKSGPPTILMFVNKSKGIPEQYQRYLKNGLRDTFRIRNTPVHLIFRSGADLARRLKEVRPQ